MPRISLTEIEKRLHALHVGVQMQIHCNRGLLLIVEKQREHGQTGNSLYHAWLEPRKPRDPIEYTFTGDLEGVIALISAQRKRKKAI